MLLQLIDDIIDGFTRQSVIDVQNNFLSMNSCDNRMLANTMVSKYIYIYIVGKLSRYFTVIRIVQWQRTGLQCQSATVKACCEIIS